MKELNLSVKGLFSPVTDQEFDTLVSEIKMRSRFHEYCMVKGNLEAAGYRVQWTRVRSSMHRVDSAGILSRLARMGCVVRQTYHVPCPLYMLCVVHERDGWGRTLFGWAHYVANHMGIQTRIKPLWERTGTHTRSEDSECSGTGHVHRATERI
ncbi:unnamed protein product [Leuciscus chuanchicus]